MANNRTLTAADVLITLSVAEVFGAPFTLHGFATDDVYDMPEIDVAETAMGVDGRLSAGFVFRPVTQAYMLQADSLSIDQFETIYAQQQQNRSVYAFTGITTLLAVGKQYAMNRGFLRNYSPAAAGKRILQPRRFGIEWESVLPQPV
jgi:hypothetical protein